MPSVRAYRRADPAANDAAHATDNYPDRRTLDSEPIVGGADGLIPLPDWHEHWWLIAEGYIWRSVVVPMSHRGVVDAQLLSPSGGLQVRTIGWAEDRNLTLLALEESRALELPAPQPTGVSVLPGVRPGRYRVVVLRGAGYWKHDFDARLLAEALVEVTVGQMAEVELRIRPEAVARATLSVRVTRASAWNWGKIVVQVSGADWQTERFKETLTFRVRPSVGGEELISDPIRIPPGAYDVRLSLLELDWVRRLHLASGEAVELPIQLADGVDITLEARGAGDGGLREGVTAHWKVSHDCGALSTGLAEVPPDTGVVRFRAPAGRMALVLLSSEYLDERLAPIDLRAGTPVKLDVNLRLAGAIALELVCADGALLSQRVVSVDYKLMSGDGEDTASLEEFATGEPVRIDRLTPGEYSVKVSVPGYHPQSLDRVLVGAGAVERIRFVLKR